MEAMGTAYCEEACRRTIKKLEVDGKISQKALSQLYMDWMFDDERDYDICTEGGDSRQENASDLSEKDTGKTKLDCWGNRLSVDQGSWKYGVFLVLNQKGWYQVRRLRDRTTGT